jgi:hypothetical protein
MAIVYATKTGNWSDTTVWNTGTLPTSADDVYSNNFIVTVDTNITVLSISNAVTTGVTAGGGFRVTANGINITCTAVFGIVAGSNAFSTALNFSHLSGTPCSLSANLSSPGNTVTTLSMSGSGTLNYTGNLPTAGPGGNSFVIGNGTVNMTGNVTTNSSGNGISVSGADTIVNFNGISYGPSGTNGNGVTISSGTLNITGEIFGGSGVDCYAVRTSGGTTTITGTISGSSVSGALANTGGTVYHIGTAQASATYPAIGPGSTSQVTILTGPLRCNSPNDASAGVNPCIALRWFPADTALGTFRYEMRGATASGSPSVRPARQMYLTDAYSSGYPSTSLVRSGVSYGPGSIYSGIATIPPRESVSYGVPVDNTTGTSAFLVSDIWNYPISGITTSGSIGERLKTAATVNVMGQLISDSFSAR